MLRKRTLDQHVIHGTAANRTDAQQTWPTLLHLDMRNEHNLSIALTYLASPSIFPGRTMSRQNRKTSPEAYAPTDLGSYLQLSTAMLTQQI